MSSSLPMLVYRPFRTDRTHIRYSGEPLYTKQVNPHTKQPGVDGDTHGTPQSISGLKHAFPQLWRPGCPTAHTVLS